VNSHIFKSTKGEEHTFNWNFAVAGSKLGQGKVKLKLLKYTRKSVEQIWFSVVCAQYAAADLGLCT
jgi:hypothetical protein